MLRFILIAVLAIGVVGCGGSKEQGSSADDAYLDEGCGELDEEEEGGSQEYTAAQGTATIKGTVKFEGTPPKRRPIDMGSEKFCIENHPEKLLSETVIVGPDGGLANVFVSVKSGLSGWKFPKAEGTQVLDQQGCMYVPHVLGMQLGESLTVRNSDPIMHNIHGFDLKSGRETFNFAQTQKGAERKQRVTRPGIIQVKCDVHGWMGSYVCVVKHPFFAVTGEDGAFTLEKLPPGEYVIEAWHEKYKTKSQTVKVGDGATADLSFSFSR